MHDYSPLFLSVLQLVQQLHIVLRRFAIRGVFVKAALKCLRLPYCDGLPDTTYKRNIAGCCLCRYALL